MKATSWNAKRAHGLGSQSAQTEKDGIGFMRANSQASVARAIVAAYDIEEAP
jgi:hypothetical protein